MGDYWIWVAVGAIGGIAILVWFFSKPKCPKCGKRKSFAASRKEVKSEHITIRKTETIKHFSKEQTMAGKPTAVLPEKVSTREYTVPGIRTHYDVTYTCRVCGEQFTRREHSDSET